MNKFLPLIVLLLTVLSQSSCRLGKRPVRKKVIVDSMAITRSQDSIKAVELNREKQQLINRLTSLTQQQIDFRSFNAKVKAHYQGPEEKHEFTINLRIEKDKTIWASVTALGMVNVARIIITPDSFKLINYLEKKVILMSLRDADTILPTPMDFQVLQNMLLGNVLKQGKITDANEFGGSWSVNTEDEDYLQQYTYNKIDSTLRSAQISGKTTDVQAMIQLGNYELLAGRKFSTARAINITNAGKAHYLDMNFNKVDFDEPVEFPFSIPQRYEVNGVLQNEKKAERIERRQERRAR
jgi:hypothetical protein